MAENIYKIDDANQGQRKLAAIMFTDMVGYSKLSQENESLAIELLREHRDILRPIFDTHNGREVETIGDAFFVEFGSTVDAASCAIEIQKTLHERNQQSTEERKILLRIGLHVGDVLDLGEHVHGDGVNIAARLEPLSQPGGICLSEDAARQVGNKIEYPVHEIGREKLKNIKKPMNIYCVQFPWLKKQKTLSGSLMLKKYSTVLYAILITMAIIVAFMLSVPYSTVEPINRLAVLPMENISNDDGNEYFADGMTEELISRFARIKDLNVIARTSVMKYKNNLSNIEEIGNELDVATILTGSIRKISNSARIAVQLIDVETQENIWSNEYNRDVKDIFAVQSEIALKIAGELEVKLLSSEIEQIEKPVTNNQEAHRQYLLGKFHFNKKTGPDLSLALKYYKGAISFDSSYALAYSGIADCYTLIGGAGYGELSRDDVIIIAHEAVSKALAIDNSLAEAYNSLAYINFRLEWNWEEAEKNFKHAIELKPGYAEAHEKYGLFLMLHKRFDEAIDHMNRAHELDPLSNSVMTGIGRAYHFAGQYDKAIEQFNTILDINPNYAEAVFARGLSYKQQQKFTVAVSELKRAAELSNQRLIILTALGITYAEAGYIDSTKIIYEKLIDRSKTTTVPPFYFAIFDHMFGKKEEAIKKLYQAYEEHSGIMVYLHASPLYTRWADNEPRFNELLEKIGF